MSTHRGQKNYYTIYKYIIQKCVYVTKHRPKLHQIWGKCPVQNLAYYRLLASKYPTRLYVREITQAQSTAGQAIRYLPPENRSYKSQPENGRLLSRSPIEDELL